MRRACVPDTSRFCRSEWVPFSTRDSTSEWAEGGHGLGAGFGAGTASTWRLTVAAAPEAAAVRVWQVMSRGREPGAGQPPLEGASVGYSPVEPRRTTLTRPRRSRNHNPGVLLCSRDDHAEGE